MLNSSPSLAVSPFITDNMLALLDTEHRRCADCDGWGEFTGHDGEPHACAACKGSGEEVLTVINGTEVF